MLRILILSSALLLSTGCRSCCDPSEENAPGTTEEAAAGGTETRETRMWVGTSSGIHDARRTVVRTPEEWKELWTRHAGERLPSDPVPEIDWTRDMVVAVVLGDRPTAGYGVDITRVAEEDGKLVVRSHATAPKPGSVQAQVVTSPFVFRTVPRFDGEVQFRDE